METEEVTTPTSSRDVRRRKIMERGSDRLALITGRIQTLNSPSNPSTPSSSTHPSSFNHSHTHSSPSTFFSQDHFPLTPNSPQVGSKDADYASGISWKHEIHEEMSKVKDIKFESRVAQQLCKSEMDVKLVANPTIQPVKTVANPTIQAVKTGRPSSHFSAKAPKKPAVNTELLLKACVSLLKSCTAKDVNSSIMASESTRVFCSITIGLMVVLSCVNLPRNLVKPKSIIASGPIYILLLTDVTIVLGRLLLEKRRSFSKDKEEDEEDEEEKVVLDDGNWGGAVKLLEVGLVFYQTLRGIFIDCSFYLVVIICGLSLM